MLKAVNTLFICLISIISYSQDVSEQLLNSTIKIQAVKDSIIQGKSSRIPIIGTAFFFRYNIDKYSIPVIVANIHTIKNCKSGTLKFNTANNKLPNYGDIVSITLKNFERLWIKHESEDLAIMPLAPFLTALNNKHKKEPFYISFGEENIPSQNEMEELKALEDILMIGYPKGFSDTINNIPIARRGMTATPPYLDYNKQKRFLIDIPTYQGSSGSPVILPNLGSYVNKNGGVSIGNRKLLLLGIATDLKEYAARGNTINKEPSKRVETITWLPFDIAVAVKSSIILDLKSSLIDKMKDDNYTQLILNSIEK